MQKLWTLLVNWFQSKGGFAHVVAVVIAMAVLAYAQVPEFKMALDQAYMAMPAWLHKLIVLAIALYGWYRNNNKVVS